MRTFVFGSLAGLSAMLAFVSSAGAQSVGGCQLAGTAKFSPGLSDTSHDFSCSFDGSLSGCQSIEGAPDA